MPTQTCTRMAAQSIRHVIQDLDPATTFCSSEFAWLKVIPHCLPHLCLQALAQPQAEDMDEDVASQHSKDDQQVDDQQLDDPDYEMDDDTNAGHDLKVGLVVLVLVSLSSFT